MNVEEYILSGIVETYVLGLADEAEQAEFEEMCRQHPQVMAARVSFEADLEKQSLQNAVSPPADVKKAILSHLELADHVAPVVSINTPTQTAYGNTEIAGTGSRMKYFAAASVILLAGSALLNFYLFSQYKNYSGLYTELVASQQRLANNNEVMQTKLQTYQEDLNLMNDTNVVMIRMPGTNVPTSPAPSSLATIYWHKKSKDVYLHVNNMPAPENDKQYQLWALVDGKPVDAGVFDIKDDIVTIKMKNIPRAQAFAVTLEKKGGSPSPNMEQLYIMGKV